MVARYMDGSGYASCHINTRTDQAPAMVECQAAVAELRTAVAVPLNRAVGVWRQNGRVETAIKSLKGIARTLKPALGRHVNLRITRGQCIYPWMIERAAGLISRHVADETGRSPWQKVRIGITQKVICRMLRVRALYALGAAQGRRPPLLSPITSTASGSDRT